MKYLISFTVAFLLGISALRAAEPLKVQYGIYASGFNVATVDATYSLNKDAYGTTAILETAGLLGTLAPWSGDIKTSGTHMDGKLIPQSHSFANTWRDETKTSQFTFDEKGQLIAFNKTDENGSVEDKMPEKEVYEDNPVDMLTALMSAMQEQSCASSQHVMDGKRRFDMVFTSKGIDNLQPNKYNVYDGDAEICEVEIVPVAGKWREKPRGWMNIQQQAKTKGQLPRLWFGKIREDMPAIPVRMLIKTNYGTMLMHLQDVK